MLMQVYLISITFIYICIICKRNDYGETNKSFVNDLILQQ